MCRVRHNIISISTSRSVHLRPYSASKVIYCLFSDYVERYASEEAISKYYSLEGSLKSLSDGSMNRYSEDDSDSVSDMSDYMDDDLDDLGLEL